MWHLAPESAQGRGGHRNCLGDAEFLQERYGQCTLPPHEKYFLLPAAILAEPSDKGEYGLYCKKCELVSFNFKQSITILQIHNLSMILPVKSRGVRIGTIATATAYILPTELHEVTGMAVAERTPLCLGYSCTLTVPLGKEGIFACWSHILHLPFLHCSLLKDTLEMLGIFREDDRVLNI